MSNRNSIKHELREVHSNIFLALSKIIIYKKHFIKTTFTLFFILSSILITFSLYRIFQTSKQSVSTTATPEVKNEIPKLPDEISKVDQDYVSGINLVLFAPILEAVLGGTITITHPGHLISLIKSFDKSFNEESIKDIKKFVQMGEYFFSDEFKKELRTLSFEFLKFRMTNIHRARTKDDKWFIESLERQITEDEYAMRESDLPLFFYNQFSIEPSVTPRDSYFESILIKVLKNDITLKYYSRLPTSYNSNISSEITILEELNHGFHEKIHSFYQLFFKIIERMNLVYFNKVSFNNTFIPSWFVFNKNKIFDFNNDFKNKIRLWEGFKKYDEPILILQIPKEQMTQEQKQISITSKKTRVEKSKAELQSQVVQIIESKHSAFNVRLPKQMVIIFLSSLLLGILSVYIKDSEIKNQK